MLDSCPTRRSSDLDLAFNLGGHINHSIFWKNLSPEGGDKPTGELASAIDEYFGSFDAFRKHFTAAALGIQGRSEEHTSELQSRGHLVCRLLLEKKKQEEQTT